MFSFRTTPLEDQLDKALTEGKVGCFCTQNCWDTSSDRYMYQISRKEGIWCGFSSRRMPS